MRRPFDTLFFLDLSPVPSLFPRKVRYRMGKAGLTRSAFLPTRNATSTGALESCDGIRIKDRRIKVDVERGRTMKDWKPRRLGGGLGGRGYTKAAPAGPPVGVRGGFPGRDIGGGFRGGGFRGNGGGFGGGRDRDRNGSGFPGGDRGFRGNDRGFGGPRDDRPSGYRERDFDRGERDRDRDRNRDRERDRDHRDRDRDRRSGGGDRDRDGGRRTGSNMEPVQQRDRNRERDREQENGGYRERSSRDDHDSRKRGFDGPPHEETRKLRRYQ